MLKDEKIYTITSIARYFQTFRKTFRNIGSDDICQIEILTRQLLIKVCPMT